VNRGGHNILEPAALGKPVLFGPHMQNFRAAAQALTEAGAGFVARDGQDLGCLAVRLLSDRTAYTVAATCARHVVQSNRGALEKTLRLIDPVLLNDHAAAAPVPRAPRVPS
jgi:3-deoxy-D-manno-octulosonic-acid transferase